MNSGILYAHRPHTPTRLQRKWADMTGVPAREVLPAMNGQPQVQGVQGRQSAAGPPSAFASLQKAGAAGNPAMERDLAVEDLRRKRIENSLLDAGTPMSMDASALTGRTRRLGEAAADVEEMGAAAKTRGAQRGIDEQLLSPLGAHAQVVRGQYDRQLAGEKAQAGAEAAAQRGMYQYMMENLKQQGLSQRAQMQEAVKMMSSYNAYRRVLQNPAGIYTQAQIDAARTAIEQMEPEMDRLLQYLSMQWGEQPGGQYR